MGGRRPSTSSASGEGVIDKSPLTVLSRHFLHARLNPRNGQAISTECICPTSGVLMLAGLANVDRPGDWKIRLRKHGVYAFNGDGILVGRLLGTELDTWLKPEKLRSFFFFLNLLCATAARQVEIS